MYIVTREARFCGAFATIEAARAAILTKIDKLNARRKSKFPDKNWLLYEHNQTNYIMEAPNYGVWPIDGQCAKFLEQQVYVRWFDEEDIDDPASADETYFDIYLAE